MEFFSPMTLPGGGADTAIRTVQGKRRPPGATEYGRPCALKRHRLGEAPHQAARFYPKSGLGAAQTLKTKIAAGKAARQARSGGRLKMFIPVQANPLPFRRFNEGKRTAASPMAGAGIERCGKSNNEKGPVQKDRPSIYSLLPRSITTEMALLWREVRRSRHLQRAEAW